MRLYPLSDPRSFGLPILIALGIQIVVLVLLSTHWMNTETHTLKSVPSHIAARVVQIEKPKPKQVKKAVKKKPVKPKVVPAKKTAPVKKKKPEAKKEKPVKKVVPKKEPDQKAIAQKQAELAKQAKEELAKAAAREQAMSELDALLAEEMAAENAQQSEKDQAAISDYASQIRALIERVWRVPPSAKHTDTVLVRLFLVPTGEVTEVQIVESSGNLALDRSAEQAVWRVGTLPVPDDAALFEKQFRRFTLKLTPENARL